jgi:CheY-like chemotaxis protein
MLVFLVDDDPIQNMINSQLIRLYDDKIEYMIYNNGVEVIQGLEEGLLPDIILLDINMPIMSGFEFLNLYQHYPNAANVFMLSSSDNEEDRKQANNYCCVQGYLIKPVSKEVVHDILLSADNKKSQESSKKY